jgi:hypothetical protein
MPCHCFIKHPTTAAERKIVSNALAYARSVGDAFGIYIAISQLTGKCPANTTEVTP